MNLQESVGHVRARIMALREETLPLDEFIQRLAVLYREDYVAVARVLDEEIDRSGRLLGWVRWAREETP
jgi:hypothetical protein